MSLNDPLKKYLPNLELGNEVTVKHVISHTSQGEVGKNFYYSGRFGWLTDVVSSSANEAFDETVKKRMLTPLKMEDTFFIENEVSFSSYKDRIALPYTFEGEIEKGRLEYGYSASSGLVSNVRDVAKLDKAINNNPKINDAFRKMTNPVDKNLPYAHGIFVQNYMGYEIVWGYGQYDFYSSLYLKVPSKNITLILFANSSLMSDPPRLIYGDVTKSLFAMSFLKNYVLENVDTILLETNDTLVEENFEKSYFKRDLLLAQSLSASYMARFDTSNMTLSKNILNYVFKSYPNIDEYANMSVLHNLSFLKDVAFYMDLGEFNYFDNQIEYIGTEELKKDPFNPYVNSYLGNYFDRKNDKDRASEYFQKIIDSPNLSPNWYTSEAKSWLQQ